MKKVLSNFWLNMALFLGGFVVCMVATKHIGGFFGWIAWTVMLFSYLWAWLKIAISHVGSASERNQIKASAKIDKWLGL